MISVIEIKGNGCIKEGKKLIFVIPTVDNIGLSFIYDIFLRNIRMKKYGPQNEP
jgi:hypothetical protein